MFLRSFQRQPIRNKLLAMVLLPLLGVLPLLGAVLLWWGNVAFDRLLITKVRSDLAVAQGYFERVLSNVGATTSAVAESHALHLALATRDDGALQGLLEHMQAREALDFIQLLPPDGSLPDSVGVQVLLPAQQGVLGDALRQRVSVPFVATRNAAPSPQAQQDSQNSETRAMVLLATRAVRDPAGRLLGHVQGGVLLNRNLPFIDHINEIVYPEGALPFGSQGTATLFLDDVRISTNVRLFGGEAQERAIGTRVSQTVRDEVLGRGRPWLDRAFVVNDWYVSAYEPLADSHGQRVGMLYVGYLERPFTLLKYGALASIGVVFFAVMIAAAFVSMRRARAIFAPIERMEATMRLVEGGALQSRVGAVDNDDEIGRLAAHLDQLLATLQRWHFELDAKVAERTRQLADTQAQLVRSEKMATVGQLTASIAHEVNNPIAVIQGNLDLLRELLPADAAAAVKPELRLIDEQVERMRLIVTQLLQFARPNEFAGYVESVQPAVVLRDCLVLVAHLLATTQIRVQQDGSATRAVAINRQELQQVLVNVLVNAIHAMPEGGTLTLRTADDGAAHVAISVADTGPGLQPDVLAQLFQPFVTRKKNGTGLGLWISRGIVERYGGEITAANGDGGGAVFMVRLRVES